MEGGYGEGDRQGECEAWNRAREVKENMKKSRDRERKGRENTWKVTGRYR